MIMYIPSSIVSVIRRRQNLTTNEFSSYRHAIIILANYKFLDLAILKVYSMKHRGPNTEFTTPALADLCECGPSPVK